MSTRPTTALGYIGRQPGTPVNRADWHTPPWVLDKVRATLGGIELDPFSSDAANRAVKAARYWDAEDDAFAQPDEAWQARGAFMNPPYGRKLFPAAVDLFLHHYAQGRIGAGIVLANNVTETGAGQALLAQCSAVCFLSRRVAFHTPDGKQVSGNTRGQMLLLYGPLVDEFRDEFSTEGTVFEQEAQRWRS